MILDNLLDPEFPFISLCKELGKEPISRAFLCLLFILVLYEIPQLTIIFKRFVKTLLYFTPNRISISENIQNKHSQYYNVSSKFYLSAHSEGNVFNYEQDLYNCG